MMPKRAESDKAVDQFFDAFGLDEASEEYDSEVGDNLASGCGSFVRSRDRIRQHHDLCSVRYTNFLLEHTAATAFPTR